MSRLSFFRQRSVLCRVGPQIRPELQAFDWSAGFYRYSDPIVDDQSGMVVNLSLVDQWMASVVLQVSQRAYFSNEKEVLQFLFENLKKQISDFSLSVDIKNIQIKDLYNWCWQLSMNDQQAFCTVCLPIIVRSKIKDLTEASGVLSAEVGLRVGRVCFQVLDVELFLALRARKNLLQIQVDVANLKTDDEIFWQNIKFIIVEQIKNANSTFDCSCLSDSVFSIELQDPISKKSQIFYTNPQST